MTKEQPDSHALSRPHWIEGYQQITPALGVPPIQLSWEATPEWLRAEMVLESGVARSSSVLEIALDEGAALPEGTACAQEAACAGRSAAAVEAARPASDSALSAAPAGIPSFISVPAQSASNDARTSGAYASGGAMGAAAEEPPLVPEPLVPVFTSITQPLQSAQQVQVEQPVQPVPVHVQQPSQSMPSVHVQQPSQSMPPVSVQPSQSMPPVQPSQLSQPMPPVQPSQLSQPMPPVSVQQSQPMQPVRNGQAEWSEKLDLPEPKTWPEDVGGSRSWSMPDQPKLSDRTDWYDETGYPADPDWYDEGRRSKWSARSAVSAIPEINPPGDSSPYGSGEAPSQGSVLDGQAREVVIPNKKLRKDGTPKKHHWVRNCILAVIIIFLLYELIGIIFAPLVLPKSDTGSESLPVTFGQTTDGSKERVMYLGNDNEEALEWRLKAISEAETEICFMTLDLRNDDSSHDIMAALYSAAERGVSVRVIVDGVAALTSLKWDPVFAELSGHSRVDVKFYNEPSLLTPWTMNYRLHEKVLKIDDTFLIVGGRNSTNYFLGDYGETQKVDRDILVYNSSDESELMNTVRRHFDAYWYYEKCTDATVWTSASVTLADRWLALLAMDTSIAEDRTWKELTDSVDDIAFIAGGIEATNKEPTLWKNIRSICATADEIIIQSPYVMLSDEMYTDLAMLSASRKVYIVTNDITDHTNVFGTMDLTHERGNITATGVTLIETQWENFVHAKAFIVGDDVSLVGSFNCDARSAYLDGECMLVVKSEDLNEQLRDEVEESLVIGYIQTAGDSVAGVEYDVQKREDVSVLWSIGGILTSPFRYLF